MRALQARTLERDGSPAPRQDRARVVYLAGSGHTGSTLLALLMDAHPGVASVGEIAIKPKIRHRGDEGRHQCSCGSLVSNCQFWAGIFQQVREQGLDFGPTNWTNDYRFTHPWLHRIFTRDSSSPPLRSFQHWAVRHLPVYRARIRRIDQVNVAFVRAVLEARRADVFLDTSKSPIRLARLLAIAEFDLRVLALVRDVRAYAVSARRRGKSLTEAAETWRKDQLAIREVIAPLAPDRSLLVRYEDLCTETARTLGRLCEFFGVAPMPVPSHLFSNDHHVLGNNMRMAGPINIRLDERWRRELNRGDEARVLRIAGDLNQEFGYRP